MDEFDDLVSRVRSWATATAEERGANLPEPATAEQIAAAESILGYALHPLLKRLFQEVANGGYGPEHWRLMPLERLTLCPHVDAPPDQPRAWPDQVLAVMDVGCAMLAAVDCADGRGGQVLLMDPNAFDSGQPEAWYLEAATLPQWLEGWLDGSSWLCEQDDPEDIAWPTPWDDAAARLGQKIQPNGSH
ncbi:SMI1/KNR4 family protein [Actinospica durhamensis]|uniref:SMI1/KNR4 family protein n=1 Tax=Actinospica durhamensis TaxID=1508375 RepID=A0A941ISC2_9ACTN|nr:SMI1/KNR4 family protein [Actinospica durhamensis]MBR7839775.1 SMI1/KNR4 family protein [Actinospica durhamensis]